MTRPILREIPLSEAVPMKPGQCYMTLSPGQWDGLLSAAYADGWTLLELDEEENPIRAYQRVVN